MQNHGEIFRSILDERGLKPSDFSEMLGITRQGVNNSLVKPKLKTATIVHYCKVLNIDPNVYFPSLFNNNTPTNTKPDNTEAYKLLELKLAAAERENEHLREKMRLQEEIYRLTLEKLTKTP